MSASPPGRRSPSIPTKSRKRSSLPSRRSPSRRPTPASAHCSAMPISPAAGSARPRAAYKDSLSLYPNQAQVDAEARAGPDRAGQEGPGGRYPQRGRPRLGAFQLRPGAGARRSRRRGDPRCSSPRLASRTPTRPSARTSRWPMPSPAIGTMPARLPRRTFPPASSMRASTSGCSSRRRSRRPTRSRLWPGSHLPRSMRASRSSSRWHTPNQPPRQWQRRCRPSPLQLASRSQRRRARPPVVERPRRYRSRSGADRRRCPAGAAALPPDLATLPRLRSTEAKAVLASVMPHQLGTGRQAGKAARQSPPRLRRGNSPAVVQLGAYGSPERVLAAWNGTRQEIWRAQGLFADERQVRQPEGHLLPPVGPRLRQRRRSAQPVHGAAPPGRQAASSATSRASAGQYAMR